MSVHHLGELGIPYELQRFFLSLTQNELAIFNRLVRSGETPIESLQYIDLLRQGYDHTTARQYMYQPGPPTGRRGQGKKGFYKVLCKHCNKYLLKTNYKKHTQSLTHKRNAKNKKGGSFASDFAKGFTKGFTNTLKTGAKLLPFIL
jgi:hypothetical protein